MEAEKEGNTKPRLGSHPAATAAGLLTDDLILEILCRLPARPLHRFKCVSVSWGDLIADPANRKKLPQTLAGFLYTTYNYSGGRRCHHFASISGGASPFDPCLQPNKYKDMALVGSCNGLLLYRGFNKRMASLSGDDSCFVVCNPATGRWVELPPQLQAQANRYHRIAGLAFDPAVSSRFHVLSFEETYVENHVTGVNIYSSHTGAWSCKEVALVEKVALFFFSKCVFVGGTMYVIGSLKYINEFVVVVVGVDMEGKVWETIHVPYGSRFGTIGSSQGCLHYAIASVDGNNKILVSEIELWCLKDCDSKELVLKHTTSINKLMSMIGKKYLVVEFHPDCDTIFLVSSGGGTLVAYDMRHHKVGRIINLEENNTLRLSFLPYVPLFSESLTDADGQ